MRQSAGEWIVVLAALLLAACGGLGVLIGVISSSTRMTVLWSQLILIPSMLLGGLMIPYSMLPEVIGKISQLPPATQAMNAFNGLSMGKEADFALWDSVILLLLSSVLAFLLAIYLFSGTAVTPRGVGIPCWRCWLWCPMRPGSFCLA